MLRMYHAQRRRGGCNPHGVSPINLGDIYYFQDGVRPMAGLGRFARPQCREPWIVIAFTNREYHPCTAFRPPTTYLTGGDLIVVKSLRDGRVKQLASWFVQWHEDNGFTKEWGEPLPIPVLPAYRPVLEYIKQRRTKRCRRKTSTSVTGSVTAVTGSDQQGSTQVTHHLLAAS